MFESVRSIFGERAEFNADPYLKLREHSFEELNRSPISDWSFVEQFAERGIFEIVDKQATGVCYDHALRGTDLDASVIQGNPIPNLKAQGYQPVALPQDGDLVIYFKEADLITGNYSTRWPFAKPLVQHFGVWRDGMVESKWGSFPDVLLHPAHVVPKSYGDACMVFRPGNPPQPLESTPWEESFE